jgi:large subunit ribosomal protein L22
MAKSGTQIAAVRETRKGATIYKTNERPGTRAEVRYVRVSAYKAREVLDLIRDKHVTEADEILQFTERDISNVIRKCLASAVANAANNDGQDPETLFVSACFADEGPTLKRWRPRARGRATRIRKRTCHITVIVSRQPEHELRLRAEKLARSGRTGAGAAGRASRRARVAQSRQTETHDHDHDHDHSHDEVVEEAVVTDEATTTTETDGTDTETVEATEAETEPVATDAADADESAPETDEKDED